LSIRNLEKTDRKVSLVSVILAAPFMSVMTSSLIDLLPNYPETLGLYALAHFNSD